MPTKKPDFDNIAKIAVDALNGIAFVVAFASQIHQVRREGRDTIENRQKEIAGSLPRNPAFILGFLGPK